MKTSLFSTTSPPPRFTLIKSIICSLALLASEQAFAIDGPCTSVAGGGAWNNPNTWELGAASHVIGCDDGDDRTVPNANDDAFIPSSTAVTLGADSFAKSVTITGKFVPGTYSLTISGDFTNNAAAAADVNFADSVVIFNSLATVGGSTATTFNTLETSAVLTLPATTVVTGNVTITAGGSIAGVLKLAPTGNHTITALAAGSTIPSLDLSGATANKTIASDTGNLTFTAVTFPSGGVSKVITFTAGTGFTMSVPVPVPADTVATCVNDGVAATASSTATVASTKSLVCTTPAAATPVNAPVDLKMNNEVETYSEEISIK